MHIPIWTLSMASSMQAALHMDPNYAKNLEVFKSSEFENMESLFNVMNKMIAGISEIKNLFPQDFANPSWERSTLPVDQAIEWTKVRVYVYSESSAMHVKKRSIPKMQSSDGKDTCQLYRCSILSENYHGEPIAFEWKIFPGTTASKLLQKNSQRP